VGDELKQVIIYTDGAAVPNPGAGGYGVVLRFGQHKKELSGGFLRTTNNRMELMAVIVGLEALKERCKVTLHSDSQYIVNAVTSGSAFRWRDNGWGMNQSGSKKAKNPDLWERLLAAYDRHEVEMVWVKGHAGIDDNERCDVLAMEACRQPELPPDPGFVESVVEDVAGDPARPRVAPVHRDKMTVEGQPCRNCGTAVVKRTPKKKTVKPGQSYYFSWYLYCPGCKNMYMVEEAKVQVGEGEQRLFGQEN
jgi:ribonuclease HI